jgi:hypothetical protein
MLSRSDYKVMRRALEGYKDKLMEVKDPTIDQQIEKDVVDEALWELEKHVGPALFWDGG